MLVRPTIRVTRTVGAVILLAVAFWVSSGSASASCGDYVTILGQPTAQGPDPTGHPMPGAPCHGPGCSAAPTSAPMPMSASPTIEPGAKELAARTLGDTLTPSMGDRPVPVSTDGRPVSRPSTPFHPPRI